MKHAQRQGMRHAQTQGMRHAQRQGMRHAQTQEHHTALAASWLCWMCVLLPLKAVHLHVHHCANEQ